MATSIQDIWRGDPWWAKLLLLIAITLFVLEAVGIGRDVGLAALNLTAVAFLFSMNRSLGEMSSTLQQRNATTNAVRATLDRMDPKP